jgi:hypothetical protein
MNDAFLKRALAKIESMTPEQIIADMEAYGLVFVEDGSIEPPMKSLNHETAISFSDSELRIMNRALDDSLNVLATKDKDVLTQQYGPGYYNSTVTAILELQRKLVTSFFAR